MKCKHVIMFVTSASVKYIKIFNVTFAQYVTNLCCQTKTLNKYVYTCT